MKRNATQFRIDGHTLEISDSLGTRGRVRAVASFMFKTLGYPIDHITQTSIYRVLCQGSMTTISDELRNWKNGIRPRIRVLA